nr:MAG TPA: hypothetical protein [Caudoviricetes sp.]
MNAAGYKCAQAASLKSKRRLTTVDDILSIDLRSLTICL